MSKDEQLKKETEMIIVGKEIKRMEQLKKDNKEKEIQLIMKTTNTYYETAKEALERNHGDLINAILELTN